MREIFQLQMLAVLHFRRKHGSSLPQKNFPWWDAGFFLEADPGLLELVDSFFSRTSYRIPSSAWSSSVEPLFSAKLGF